MATLTFNVLFLGFFILLTLQVTVQGLIKPPTLTMNTTRVLAGVPIYAYCHLAENLDITKYEIKFWHNDQLLATYAVSDGAKSEPLFVPTSKQISPGIAYHSHRYDIVLNFTGVEYSGDYHINKDIGGEYRCQIVTPTGEVVNSSSWKSTVPALALVNGSPAKVGSAASARYNFTSTCSIAGQSRDSTESCQVVFSTVGWKYNIKATYSLASGNEKPTSFKGFKEDILNTVITYGGRFTWPVFEVVFQNVNPEEMKPDKLQCELTCTKGEVIAKSKSPVVAISLA